MYADNEWVEFVTAGEQEYDEVVEEYEEEILVQEDVPEPPVTDFAVTDFADIAPAQGKPRCITLTLNNNWIYIYDVHLRYRHFMKTTCINISTYESY